MDESLEEEGRDKQVGIEGVGVELSGEGSPGRRMKTGTNRTGMGLGNLVRPSKIKGREHIRLCAIDRLVLPQADPKFQRFNVSEKMGNVKESCSGSAAEAKSLCPKVY